MLKIAWAVLVSFPLPQSGQFVRQPSKKPAEKCDALGELKKASDEGVRGMGKALLQRDVSKKKKMSPEIKYSFQKQAAK